MWSTIEHYGDENLQLHWVHRDIKIYNFIGFIGTLRLTTSLGSSGH